MFFESSQLDTRSFFFTVWQKYQDKIPLSALEEQILQVILDHPEYHQILNNLFANLEKNWTPEQGETNPFLHMGLHLALREQITTNRPAGIQAVYQSLLMQKGDRLSVEHMMMDALAEALWLAQKNHCPPDEADYLTKLRALLS